MLHNLLTPDRKKHLRNEYYGRLATVGSVLFACTVVLGIGALIPAYVWLRTELSILEQEAVWFDAEQAEEVAKPFATLTTSAQLVARLERVHASERVTDIIIKVFNARPSGISVTGISYERETSRVTLEGIAATRDALVTFRRSLDQNDRFADVTNPTGALTQSEDLPFRIAATLVAPPQ